MKFKANVILIVSALLLFAQLMPVTYGQRAAKAQEEQAQSPRRDSHVIMISIDGLIPEYYTAPRALGLRVPNMTRMKLNGAYADGVEGVYPTVTYPSHTTMATGVRPEAHGIVQNRVFEPPTEPQTKAWYWFAKSLKAETLWTLARKQGLSTAAVGWPVTAGAEIDYNVPEIWDPAEQPITGKRMAEYATPGLIKSAIGGRDLKGDDFRTAVSEFIIGAYKPNLMLIHLIELDEVHHGFGPRTPQALQTAEKEDAFIGRIVGAAEKAGIKDATTFLIVSDHGFAAIEKKYAPNVRLVEEKLITLDKSGKATSWKAAAWPAGGSCAIVLRDPSDKETAEKVIQIFSKTARKEKGPLNRILVRKELDNLGGIPEAVLMLEAASGYSFDDALTGPEVQDSGAHYKGTHGYLPSRAEMRSSLIVFGQGARTGARLALARMIDIGPTAAGILGLTLEDAEGRPIVELLKDGVAPKPSPSKKGGKKTRPSNTDKSTGEAQP